MEQATNYLSNILTSIGRINEAAEGVSHLIQAQDSNATSIAEEMQSVNVLTGEIENSAAEQRRTTGEINSAVESFSKNAESFLSDVSNLEQAVSQLSKIAGELESEGDRLSRELVDGEEEDEAEKEAK